MYCKKHVKVSLVPRPAPFLVAQRKVTGSGAWELKSRDHLCHNPLEKMAAFLYKDFLSAVSLWHQRAIKKSYKKCTFATFTRLRIARVLTHAHNYLSTTFLLLALRT